MTARTLLPATVAALGLVAVAATGAVASPPRMYHNVSVESASLDTIAVVDDCLQQEIFVSSTAGHWVGRQSGSNRQEGPTAVFIRVIDLCAAGGTEGMTAAAAPPGGSVVLQVEAQAMIGLQTDQQLTYASVSGVLPGTDQEGNPVSVVLDARWTQAGALEHQTYSSHDNLPEGTVSATSNEWSRPATAVVTVSVEGMTFHGVDPDSMVSRVKGRCIEVPKGSNPAPEEFFPCFGFPA